MIKGWDYAEQISKLSQEAPAQLLCWVNTMSVYLQQDLHTEQGDKSSASQADPPDNESQSLVVEELSDHQLECAVVDLNEQTLSTFTLDVMIEKFPWLATMTDISTGRNVPGLIFDHNNRLIYTLKPVTGSCPLLVCRNTTAPFVGKQLLASSSRIAQLLGGDAYLSDILEQISSQITGAYMRALASSAALGYLAPAGELENFHVARVTVTLGSLLLNGIDYRELQLDADAFSCSFTTRPQ